MIYGIGTDIVAIARIRRALERHGERLARRILAEREWGAYQAHGDPAVFLAKRFAAKEAAAKALGLGFSQGLTLASLWVDHDPNGRPELRFEGAAARIWQERGLSNAYLSISDEKDNAIAFVVLTAGE